MRRPAVLAAIVAAAIFAVLAVPAAAHHTDQADRNDTDGRLDLREVIFDHFSGPLRWKVTSFQRWTIDQLWDAGFVIVELDTRGDGAIDRRLVVSSDGEELVGHLFRVRRDGTQVELARISAGKDGRRSMTFAVALHKLAVGEDRTSYSWSVLSTFVGSACPQTCFDRVPDVGMVEQPVPGVSPSPSPSPSPTP